MKYKIKNIVIDKEEGKDTKEIYFTLCLDDKEYKINYYTEIKEAYRLELEMVELSKKRIDKLREEEFITSMEKLLNERLENKEFEYGF